MAYNPEGTSRLKPSIRVATTADVADLATGAPDPVDGVSLAVDDRILVANQSTGSENGLYRVVTVGTGSDGAWVRADDADQDEEVRSGDIVYVREGSAPGLFHITTADPITVGSTAITYTAIGEVKGSGTAAHLAYFSDGTTITSESAGELYWDAINNRLGVLTPSPDSAFHVAGNAHIEGNLTVDGTTTTVDSETVLIADNHLYLNNGYTADTPQTGGIVINVDPDATATEAVAAGGFVAGIAATSNPTIEVASTTGFAASDLIQVSGSTSNDGIYEVQSLLTTPTRIEVRGIGTDATVEDFTATQLTAEAGTGQVDKIKFTVIRAGTDGLPETATGDATPLTFTDFNLTVSDVSKVGTPVDNQVAVWTGDGTIEGDANFTWDGSLLSVDGGSVFNEAGASVDFRIEGDTEPNLFLVDGSENEVNINGLWTGRPSPIAGSSFSINNADTFFGGVGSGTARGRLGGNANQAFYSHNNYYDGSVEKAINTGVPSFKISLNALGAAADSIVFERAPATAGTQSFAALMTVKGSGRVGIGQPVPGGALVVNNGTSADNIFDLEDNGTNVLTVVDGGNVAIGSGGATSAARLYVLASNIANNRAGIFASMISNDDEPAIGALKGQLRLDVSHTGAAVNAAAAGKFSATSLNDATVRNITGYAGVNIELSIQGSNTTVTDLYGMIIPNIGLLNSTITNTYGIHIGELVNGGGTQTNTPYGIFQVAVDARNYFGSKTGIGVAAPDAWVDIDNGATTDPILQARDNGVIRFEIDDGGNACVGTIAASTYRFRSQSINVATIRAAVYGDQRINTDEPNVGAVTGELNIYANNTKTSSTQPAAGRFTVNTENTASARTIAAQTALNISNSCQGASTTITKMYGLFISSVRPGSTSTATDTYGIYISDVTGGGTQTNTAFGLYQESDDARNYFGSKTGFGVIDPLTAIHAAGAIGSDATALVDGANIATDAAGGNVFTVTLAGNRTLDNPTNMVAGFKYTWVITQDGTGSRTLAYGANFKFPGGTAPTLSTAASAVDKLEAVYDGTNLLTNFALAYS